MMAFTLFFVITGAVHLVGSESAGTLSASSSETVSEHGHRG